MLRLWLFGAPRVDRDGELLPLRRTKALALLAYLVLSGRPVEREALTALLWPEFDDATSRNNLRRELSLLRSALGDDVLVAHRNQIAWGHEAASWVDVSAFQALLNSHREHRHAPGELCQACAAALAEAAQLARDDFLAGFGLAESAAFDDWQFFQREQLRRQLGEALSLLIGWHSARAEYREAIEYAQRWLALDQLHEPAHRALMRLYAWSDQQSAALRQYATCARLLDQELGLAPEPETSELHEAIRLRQLPPPSAAEPRGGQQPALPAPAPVHAALPPARASFIGRAQHLAEVRRRLLDPGCRVLTLVGPGGIGKTSLALQAAQQLAAEGGPEARFDAIQFVSLASIRDVGLVVPTIARALGLPAQAGQGAIDHLAASLRGRRALLLLDNFEQVLGATPQLAALLDGAPQLQLLVTSRAALRIRGEQEYALPSMGLFAGHQPGEAQPPVQPEAVQLFVERARAVRADFELNEENAQAVGAICDRLDGLPLAIELAAARMRVLSPQALLCRLERRLPLLSDSRHDSHERHRTLRDTIAWSYDLLEPAEQRLFRQLAVFVGGATIEAVEAICEGTAERTTLDLLESLLAQSLLLSEEADGETRVRMLATIHEYAEERLVASGEQDALEQRHADYYTAWAAQAHDQLFGPAQLSWSARLSRELDNMWALLQRAQARGDYRLLLRLTGELARFWGLKGYLQEGRSWLEAALAALQRDPSPRSDEIAALQARTLLGLGYIAWLQGEQRTARDGFSASLELYQALNHQFGAAQALNGLGIISAQAGQELEAHDYYVKSLALFRAIGHQERVANVLNNLANTLKELGKPEQARVLHHEALTLQRASGNTIGTLMVLHNLGVDDHSEGLLDESRTSFEEYLAICRRLDYQEKIISPLNYLGLIAVQQGQLLKAQNYLDEAIALSQKVGSQLRHIEALEGWAYLAATQERLVHAVRLFAAATAMRERHGIYAAVEEAPVGPARSRLLQQLGTSVWRRAWQEGLRSEWQALVEALRVDLARGAPAQQQAREAQQPIRQPFFVVPSLQQPVAP